jgi:SAM-dependent methyltransferase
LKVTFLLRGLVQAGGVAEGVEIDEYMVQLGRRQWPELAPSLHICDAVNLHLFGDAGFDAVHASQVAHLWKPELVPFVLRELARVTVPGGLLFCSLKTDEVVARQGKRQETEEVCIRPMRWWHERLEEAGWCPCSMNYETALRSHPEGFLQRYDWDWFIAKKTISDSHHEQSP